MTDFDLAVALRMFRRGDSIAEIAEAVGSSATTTWRRLRAAGASERTRRGFPADAKRQAKAVKLRDAGRTFSEIGEALGVSKQRAQQIYKAATAVVEAEDDE